MVTAIPAAIPSFIVTGPGHGGGRESKPSPLPDSRMMLAGTTASSRGVSTRLPAVLEVAFDIPINPHMLPLLSLLPSTLACGPKSGVNYTQGSVGDPHPIFVCRFQLNLYLLLS